MKFNSIRFKVSALLTGILGVVLIAYSSFLYYSLSASLYGELKNDLERKSRAVSSALTSYLDILQGKQKALLHASSRVISLSGEYSGSDRNVTPDQLGRIGALEKKWREQYDKLDLNEDYLHFVSADGRTLARSRNVSEEMRGVFLKKLRTRQDGELIFSKISFRKKNLLMIQLPFETKDGKRYVIQVATTQKPVIALLNERQGVFLVSIPVLLALIYLIGWFLADRILVPVARVTETARHITHENLKGRLDSAYHDDEMRTLVEAFNEMISRLEKSFQHIAEFSSQVAHELKTPIAIIRGECEIALRKARTPEEYKRVIRVNLEETHRMLKTVDDLLVLAKLDYRPEIFRFERINVKKFFDEIYEQSRILADPKKITVEYVAPGKGLHISGDLLHLRRLFFNIIDNAIKFTPCQGQVSIQVSHAGKELWAEIRDTGPGIGKDDLPRVFDRFFHRPAAESSPIPGNGLGLSISLAIAKIHKGAISVRSPEGQGAVFLVKLPVL